MSSLKGSKPSDYYHRLMLLRHQSQAAKTIGSAFVNGSPGFESTAGRCQECKVIGINGNRSDWDRLLLTGSLCFRRNSLQKGAPMNLYRRFSQLIFDPVRLVCWNWGCA